MVAARSGSFHGVSIVCPERCGLSFAWKHSFVILGLGPWSNVVGCNVKNPIIWRSI